MKTSGFRIGVFWLGCAVLFTAAAQPQSQYIQIDGTHFMLHGSPYYVVGTNFWYGYYLGARASAGNRERLGRELDRLKAAGINNLRILGGSEQSDIQNSLKPAIQTSPGVYRDTLLEGLDFLLSEMQKRGMHAVVMLNNFWEWSGGMAQYHSWFGGGPVKDPMKDGYYAFMDYSSAFYRNAPAQNGFRSFVAELINRKNQFTGLYYFEDPAIMAWELANEPRPGNGNQYVDSFYVWIDRTAQYIHSIDPHHLVTTGNEGTMGCLGSEAIYVNAHQSSYVDYVTIHVWALNWGWYNPADTPGTYGTTLMKARQYIQKHTANARALNKPLTVEEFGLPRDGQQYSPGSTTRTRDKYFSALLQMIYDSAAAGSPVAGSNFWGWGGEGRSPNADYSWRVGDPFVCDPPMEKQGLNSVYDSDSSTLDVITRHSALMSRLAEIRENPAGNIVGGFMLNQNYPNPFNPSTTIGYSLPCLPAGRLEMKGYRVWGT
jgi:mannan endo-1,4-beta-mannosidase